MEEVFMILFELVVDKWLFNWTLKREKRKNLL